MAVKPFPPGACEAMEGRGGHPRARAHRESLPRVIGYVLVAVPGEKDFAIRTRAKGTEADSQLALTITQRY
jgi:hypothetical protein